MRTGQEAFTIQHVAVDKCAPSQSRHTESKHSKLGNEYPDVMMLVALVILLSSAPCAFSIVFALPHKIGRVSTCSRNPKSEYSLQPSSSSTRSSCCGCWRPSLPRARPRPSRSTCSRPPPGWRSSRCSTSSTSGARRRAASRAITSFHLAANLPMRFGRRHLDMGTS